MQPGLYSAKMFACNSSKGMRTGAMRGTERIDFFAIGVTMSGPPT
jgi:hypothetical protein